MYEQIDLWSCEKSHDPQFWKTIPLIDGEIVFYPEFFTSEESDRFYLELDRDTQWKQDSIKIFGRSILLPRLTAWYGDSGKSYTYSGIAMHPTPWTKTLLEIKSRIEEVAGIQFNSVLLNKYRTGKDSVAWHSDDEVELGLNPIIGSVSFGGTRRFVLKHKERKEVEKISIDLTHGSFLLMRGNTQDSWQHQIPKTAKAVESRINLTFRVII